MQRVWLLRVIEALLVFAFIAEVWRFLTINNTTQDVVVDAIELVGLIVLGLVCLYMEMRLRRSPEGNLNNNRPSGVEHG